MTKVEINGQPYLLPSKFNELSERQLLFISALQAKSLTKENFEVQVIRYLLGVEWKLYSKLNGNALKSIARALNFLHLESGLTTQLIPTLKVGRKKFKGADSGLQNFTFEQFFDYSEMAFMLYTQTKEVEFLDMLIACIYTLKGKFNPDKVESNAAVLAKLQLKYKIAIMQFYLGSRADIIRRFPNAFSGKAQKKIDPLNFIKLVDALNLGDVTKNKDIKEVKLYEMLVKLNKKHDDKV